MGYDNAPWASNMAIDLRALIRFLDMLKMTLLHIVAHICFQHTHRDFVYAIDPE
jgi:hypothetical protein